MTNSFKVTAAKPDYIFGELSEAIELDLGKRYLDEFGITHPHWTIWCFDNGAVIPVPMQICPDKVPPIRVCRLFLLTAEEIQRSDMQSLPETDTFAFNIAKSLAEDLCRAGLASITASHV